EKLGRSRAPLSPDAAPGALSASAHHGVNHPPKTLGPQCLLGQPSRIAPPQDPLARCEEPPLGRGQRLSEQGRQLIEVGEAELALDAA
ncbi:MAG TPA: hypothetical protein VHT52_09265, partial [Stellaceae bacterium]|nr:hypothetical protein [Stellaceae bacterium]